jgi:predicted metalloendopeptidase
MLRKHKLLTGAMLAAVVAISSSPKLVGAQVAEGLPPNPPTSQAPQSTNPSGRIAAAAPQPEPAYGRWGFDDSGVDPKVSPGDSFYDFASGKWDATTVIPADKSRYGMFDTLIDTTQEQVRAIIEEDAKSTLLNTDAGKIGALYNAFMDEARIEQLDVIPIAGDLAEIRDTKTKADIAGLMGRARGDFGNSLFFITVSEDEKDPTRHVSGRIAPSRS